jgi:hypothetical protein
MKKTFYLLAILMCASLSGIKAQAVFYPDATNPTTFIYDFNEERGNVRDGYSASGWLFNNTTSGAGRFWYTAEQTGGVLSLYRAQESTNGYYNYNTFVFSPALDVSTGKTLKMKYSTTGLNGTIQARVYDSNNNQQNVNIPVTEGEYILSLTLTENSVANFNLSAGNGGTFTGPGYINIDYIQIGPDMPATPTSVLAGCTFADDFNGSNPLVISDANKTVSVNGNVTYAAQSDGMLNLRSGAIGTYQKYVDFTFASPVDISANPTYSLKLSATGYTAGRMQIRFYDADGTWVATYANLTDWVASGVNLTNQSLPTYIGGAGSTTGFDYTQVTQIWIGTDNTAIAGTGSILIDYIQLGAVPLESESIPASEVGTPIMPIDMSANVCSCITPESWSATGLPDGLVINSSTGIISGTPTVADSDGGTATVTMTYDTDKTFSVEVPYGIINTATGIDAAGIDKTPVSVRYYNLQGVEISAPVKGQVYIAKEVYPSGAVKAVKGVK